eukprot:6214375-Pleurochrysis_carterae.AAC.5
MDKKRCHVFREHLIACRRLFRTEQSGPWTAGACAHDALVQVGRAFLVPGRAVEALLSASDLELLTQPTAAPTRICTTLLSPGVAGGTEVIDPSGTVSEMELDALLGQIEERLHTFDALAFCGTCPSGASQRAEQTRASLHMGLQYWGMTQPAGGQCSSPNAFLSFLSAGTWREICASTEEMDMLSAGRGGSGESARAGACTSGEAHLGRSGNTTETADTGRPEATDWRRPRTS